MPILHRTMDVTRSVASPSDDIKKAAVFEKDALLSAQTMIYDDGEMKKTLPGDVYERFKQALVDGGATSDEDQEAISKALYAWARERGATDYAHWFFPMRGGSGATLCGNQPVRRVHSATMWPRWLHRAVRNRHRHAIEQVSRRFRTNAP